MTDVKELPDRFFRLCQSLKADASNIVAVGWFGVVSGLYMEPHRGYHTLGHVATLLGRLEGLIAAGKSTALGYRLEVETAIWFHDAIYDVKSSENERNSASLAQLFLRTIGVDAPGFVDRVTTAILSTVHDGTPVTGEGSTTAALMCDLDLAGLADDWDAFDLEARNIRHEYSIYTDEQYRWGRLKFLSALMSRPFIFTTLAELEAPARRNIERHMADLLAGRL